MPRTILISIISVLTILFTGCPGNQQRSNDKVPDTNQQTTPGSQEKAGGTAPSATGQPAQAVPGSGPVINVDQLLQAALNGNRQVIEHAVENGFDVESTDSEMHTLLMMAAYNGHSGIVELLLDKGAKVDHRDIMDRTALMYASTGPFNKTVTLLLDAGADPNLVDGDEHFTPLMFAAAEGQAEVVRTLLDHGANKTMVDVDGESAYDFALNNGHPEVAKMLK